MTRRTERAVDVEDLLGARRHATAELAGEGRRQTRGLRPAWRVLKAADGRPRGERRPVFWTTAGGHLQQRIVPELVEADAILVAATDGHGAGRDTFGHGMPDPGRVTPAGHRTGQPPADAGLLPGLPQQPETGAGGLVAAIEINCELLADGGWRIKGQRRILAHGGRGARCGYAGTEADTGLLRESRPLRHRRQRFSEPRCMIRASRRGLVPAYPGRVVDHQ